MYDVHKHSTVGRVWRDCKLTAGNAHRMSCQAFPVANDLCFQNQAFTVVNDLCSESEPFPLVNDLCSENQAFPVVLPVVPCSRRINPATLVTQATGIYIYTPHVL